MKIHITIPSLLRMIRRSTRAFTCALIIALLFGLMPETSQAASQSGLSWLSGSNDYPNLGTLRGRPLDVVVTWEDSGNWSGTETPYDLANGQLNGYMGMVSFAVPMLSNSSDSMSACGSGAYNSHFTDLGQSLIHYNRANSFVRIGWEGNGNWYAWSVDGNPTAWIACFRQEETALKAADPAAQVDWNMNKDSSPSGIGAQMLYPGDQYVDVIGVDFYDDYPAYASAAAWNDDYNSTYNGGPRGIGSWLAFAKAHNKKLSFPEWGINNGGGGDGGDDANYIAEMYTFFKTNASNIAYESYFNAQCPNFCIDPASDNPLAAAEYESLWKPATRTSPSSVTGDINGDMKVNAVDLSILLSNWDTDKTEGDLNHDNVINILDLSILLANWTG